MDTRLLDDIRARSFGEIASDEGPARLISLQATREIAQAHELPLAQVELTAIRDRILPARYQRSLGTVGWEGQAKLLESAVAVVGAGGLGGWIIEGLARMGVGKLVVIDADVTEENNLNRQLVATEETLGQPKAELAAARVRQINGAIQVEVHVTWADAGNLPRLLSGVQVVVDALDTLPSRLTLQKVAGEMGLPMVHGAIAGFTGQVMTILPGDPGLFALYGEGPVPERGLEARLGNPAATPMMIASWEVQEVVKIITGSGRLLRNRLLLLDAEAGDVEILALGEND